MIRYTLILLAMVFLSVSFSFCVSENEDIVSHESGLTICTASCRNDALAKEQPLKAQVVSEFTSLLRTDNWPPRWNCGTWSPFLGWFYIASDFLIWAAYFTIPGILFYFTRKNNLIKSYKGIFFFFIGFILLCGLTHLIDVLIFWWPAYRVSAIIRFGTAIISIGTVFALVKIVPRALELKSPELLEKLVKERTDELIDLNKKYEKELQEGRFREAEIKRLNKELSDFKKAITDSTIVSKTDQKGAINFVNSHFEKISGYKEEELLGENHRIINSGYHDREFWIKMWKTIAKGETWRADVKNRKKNGDYYWVDTFIMPFKNENGKIYEYLSIRNDITERKRAEEELKLLNNNLELRVEEKTRDIQNYSQKISKLNDLFEAVQMHAQMGVWAYKFLNDNIYLSKEVYTIFEVNEEVSPTVSYLVHLVQREFRSKLVKAIRGSIEKGEKYDLELKIETGNRNEKWIRVIGIPEFSNDKLTSIKGLIQNINKSKLIESELRESQQSLTQINEELSSFSYSVSHDLRAPIRYISGHAKILEEDYYDRFDNEGKEVLQVIRNNTTRMGKLIDDLLDFSRVGRIDLKNGKCNMNEIVRSVLKELLMHEDRSNIDIKIDELAAVHADKSLINQVWMNLISNALKYSQHKENRKIEISSDVTNNEVVYHISDNGTGFDMAYSHKLFGVFQRLHKQEEFEGTGVGLAIVHKIIQKHNGKIWVEAREGQGATFHFSLPKLNKND